MSSLQELLAVLLQLLPAELRYEIEENDQRKSYTFTEKAELQEKLSKIYKEKFPVGKKGNDKELCQQVGTLADAGIKRVDDVIGKAFNESGETVRKRRIIHNAVKNDPKKHKIVDKIDSAQMSIAYAKKMFRREDLKLKPTPPLPEGKYDLIYIDPPWEYDLQLSGSPDYKTQTLEELKKIQLPTAKDCIVFMWATNPKLAEAIDLVHHWGLEYKTNIVWVKSKDGKLQKGTGFNVVGSHELLLMATKGKPGVPAEVDRPASVVFAERKAHSEKPQVFYEIIEKMFPNKKYLEMYARPKERRNNWTYWGDEAN